MRRREDAMDIQEMIRRLHEQADALADVISALPESWPGFYPAADGANRQMTTRNGSAPKARATRKSPLDSTHES